VASAALSCDITTRDGGTCWRAVDALSDVCVGEQ